MSGAAAASLPPALRPTLELLLGTGLAQTRLLGGGDTSAAYHLTTPKGDYVVKATRRDLPQVYFAEAQGLHLLRGAAALPVPEVVGYGDAPGGFQFLLLSYLPPGPQTAAAHEHLGRGLAALHRHTSATFGGTAANYMGALPQANPPADSAAEFFWTARLAPQVRLAGPRLSASDHGRFERLRAALPRLIPPEPACLVHGDLWAGNVRYTPTGPALIDPAATYSHREVDLSLLRLFGGVPQRVLAAYAEALPPAPGWQARADLWNLYPLLVHLNLFGASYLPRLQSALGGAERLL